MRVVVSILTVAALSLIGCEPPPVDVASPAPKAASSAPINLVIGDEKKFDELLASHKGKVVFVDFWATWCGPCVEYFPHTVATHNKYKDKEFATIAVSFDLLESEPKVREFLAEKGAGFDNLLSNYDDIGQEVAMAFGWEALPEFRLYDRTGKLRHEWTSKPDDLDQRIEELLAEKVE